ncbi:hypothetical protein COF80_17025 [Bacillus toyonensis]|uniref:hypothetical protein n=1 Tax=Bacillus toyonensis TaxID=155322 RepID=UPI000BFCA0BA|nr:hypothetical protein [Bacillus toyonensis]PHE85086.1 hypothetical protein COF80_17025 [Bacillus toyonensis]
MDMDKKNFDDQTKEQIVKNISTKLVGKIKDDMKEQLLKENHVQISFKDVFGENQPSTELLKDIIDKLKGSEGQGSRMRIPLNNLNPKLLNGIMDKSNQVVHATEFKKIKQDIESIGKELESIKASLDQIQKIREENEKKDNKSWFHKIFG